MVPQRPLEPYEDGPVEILPNIFLGAEDSVFHWDAWTKGKKVVRVMCVAQEIDNPFEPAWAEGSKDKGKVGVGRYAATHERPEVVYAHLKWSHGESGLAELESWTTLDDVIAPKAMDVGETWRFWEAIRWIEEGRQRDEPVLIQYVSSIPCDSFGRPAGQDWDGALT